MKQEINSKHAPQAIGPYAQAIQTGSLIFCSGQLGLDPKTGALVEGGVAAQTKQVLANLLHVLKEAGCELSDIVKTTVFLQRMDDFAAMNEVYTTAFSKPFPARSTIEVAKLPKGGLVEIECVACVKKDEAGCCGGNCGGDCCKEEKV